MDETEAGRGLGAGNKSLPSSGEVDFKTKAGTAWSHSFLNQKPWHPLSYPNQRRKWIAEQTHAQKQRRAEEVAREYAQEQEFLRQAALLSKKEQEKLEMMKAVSFLYVKPPGYNAESAKAAEVADVKRKQADEKNLQEPSPESSSVKVDNRLPEEEKKKPRPKDVFGRALPTEEQFEVLKNAPRLETGVAGRAKPFGVEIRNVKCLRCGNYGHQSGDRECPLKDAIMPNEESRLKRDDPLTAILAQTDPTEPLKWELKQKPGMSPPRGGFDPDDPNQQIVAEDIFDEYGGFLGEVNIPELLTDFSKTKTKTKTKTKKRKSNKSSKHRRRSPSTEIRDDEPSGPSSGDDRGRWQEKKRHKRKKQRHSESDSSESSDRSRHRKRESRHHKQHYPSSSEGSGPDERVRSHRDRHHHSHRDRHQHPRQDGRQCHIPHRDGHRHHHSVPS